MPRKQKQKRKHRPAFVTGVAWYKPEEWDAWKAACPGFEETYAEWEPYALEHVRTMGRKGISVRKVVIGLEAFLAWCQENGQSPDGAGRAAYVAELLQERHNRSEAPGS